MSSTRASAEAAIRTFLTAHQLNGDSALDVNLFAGGLGLDSLATAELSAVLEDAVGTDPFSEGDMPQTIGGVLDFYGADEAALDAR